MTIRVAINGFGRIGRNVFRALCESKTQEIEVVAINDLGRLDINAHLLQYDSVHGRFQEKVTIDNDDLIVGDKLIHYYSERDVASLPWKKHNIDLVMECTGVFTSKESAGKHLDAGAGYVLISAPASDVDLTVVYGVNHELLNENCRVVSNASCTTNCLAPLAKVINDEVGIKNGLMTTIHAYTNDQRLSDTYHSDPHRARAANLSLIPTKTGAASAVGKVLPELKGKLNGLAIRAPSANVSLVDLTAVLERESSVEELNALLEHAAEEKYKGIIEYNTLPLVSIDFNHNPASCIFDSTQSQCNDNLAKVFAWYDNEWGYSNRMIDTSLAWMGVVDSRTTVDFAKRA